MHGHNVHKDVLENFTVSFPKLPKKKKPRINSINKKKCLENIYKSIGDSWSESPYNIF